MGCPPLLWDMSLYQGGAGKTVAFKTVRHVTLLAESICCPGLTGRKGARSVGPLSGGKGGNFSERYKDSGFCPYAKLSCL
jgi:hypothetical protein